MASLHHSSLPHRGRHQDQAIIRESVGSCNERRCAGPASGGVRRRPPAAGEARPCSCGNSPHLNSRMTPRLGRSEGFPRRAVARRMQHGQSAPAHNRPTHTVALAHPAGVWPLPADWAHSKGRVVYCSPAALGRGRERARAYPPRFGTTTTTWCSAYSRFSAPWPVQSPRLRPGSAPLAEHGAPPAHAAD